MIAVTHIGGHQAIVKKGDTLSVDKIEAEVGKTVQFPVLLVSGEDGKDFQIGAPILEGAVVKAKIIEQHKDDKIRVFKMKPRKRYRRTYGHRTHLTKIEITDISTGTTKKKETGSTSSKTSDPKPKKTETKKPAAQKAAPKKVDKK